MNDSGISRLSRPPHSEPLYTRRDFLLRGGAGFGALALTYLLGDKLLFAAELGGSSAISPLAPKKPQLRPRAKSVIFLFMEGGPSHLDLFDPKPKLNELAGQPLPESFGSII